MSVLSFQGSSVWSVGHSTLSGSFECCDFCLATKWSWPLSPTLASALSLEWKCFLWRVCPPSIRGPPPGQRCSSPSKVAASRTPWTQRKANSPIRCTSTFSLLSSDDPWNLDFFLPILMYVGRAHESQEKMFSLLAADQVSFLSSISFAGGQGLLKHGCSSI